MPNFNLGMNCAMPNVLPYGNNSVFGPTNSAAYGAPNSAAYGGTNPLYGATNSIYGAPSSMYGALPYPGRRAIMGKKHGLPTAGFYSHLAETKMKTSFRSIETVLETVASISNVLEDSFSLVTNSIRSITSLADNLLDVKKQFGELAFIPRLLQTIVGFIQWVLKALGLDNSILYQKLDKHWENAFISAEGSQALSQAMRDAISKSDADKPFAPVIYFLALLLGLPLIAMRLLGGPTSPPPSSSSSTRLPDRWWLTPELNHHGVLTSDHALHDMTLKKGQHVWVPPISVKPGAKYVYVATMTNPVRMALLPAKIVRITFG